jgi:hypothetical protein
MLELAVNVVEPPEHVVLAVGLTAKVAVAATVTATEAVPVPQDVVAVTV